MENESRDAEQQQHSEAKSTSYISKEKKPLVLFIICLLINGYEIVLIALGLFQELSVCRLSHSLQSQEKPISSVNEFL